MSNPASGEASRIFIHQAKRRLKRNSLNMRLSLLSAQPRFPELNGSEAFDDSGSRLLSSFAIRFSDSAQMLKAVCLIGFKSA